MLLKKQIVPIFMGLLFMIALTACGGYSSSVSMVGVHTTATTYPGMHTATTTSTGTTIATTATAASTGTTIEATATATSTRTTIEATATATSTGTATSTMSNFLVKAGRVYVGDTKVRVLTDQNGLPLYYSLTDTKTESYCTGKCTDTWAPLLYNGGSKVPTNGSLSGTLSVVSTANGNQVAYNGHLLYHYRPDVKAPTSANGEGVMGIWFVALPALQPNLKTGS